MDVLPGVVIPGYIIYFVAPRILTSDVLSFGFWLSGKLLTFSFFTMFLLSWKDKRLR